MSKTIHQLAGLCRGAFLPLTLALALLLGVSVGVATQATAPTVAQASAANNRADDGKGYKMLDGRWVGSFVTNKGPGFCTEFADVRGRFFIGGLLTTTQLGGMSKPETVRAMYIAEKYRTTASRKLGAASQLAVWELEGSPQFRAWHKRAKLTKQYKALALGPIVTRILRESLNAGKNLLSASSNAGLPGQKIKVSVRGRVDNKVAAGRVVTVAMINAVPAKFTIRLGAQGTGARYVTVTREGKVSGTATMSAPANSGVVSQDPGAFQQLVFKRHSTTLKAVFSAQKFLSGVSIISNCDDNCEGIANVVIERYVLCGSSPVHTSIFLNGVGASSFVASACKWTTKSIKVSDGVTVTTNHCFTKAGVCYTPRRPDAGKYVVVCPPWISAVATSTTKTTWACDTCSSVTTTSVIALTAPKSTRGYVAHVKLGAKVVHKVVPAGTTVTMPAGNVNLKTVSISFTAYTNAARTKAIKTYVLGGQQPPTLG